MNSPPPRTIAPNADPIQTVLIVEDDDSIRRVAELALSRVGGWRTLVAADGPTAIEISREQQPDLILMDVMLPRLDGPATLGRLRQHPDCAQIPVIFMTARIQAHERRQYAALGALGVIAKPFDPMTLPEQITALWRGAQASADPGPDHADPALERLRHAYAPVIPRRVKELHAAVVAALATGSTTAQRTHAAHLAHQLAGSAGTFGAPAVGTLAATIEQALRTGDDDTASQTLQPLLQQLVPAP